MCDALETSVIITRWFRFLTFFFNSSPNITERRIRLRSLEISAEASCDIGVRIPSARSRNTGMFHVDRSVRRRKTLLIKRCTGNLCAFQNHRYNMLITVETRALHNIEIKYKDIDFSVLRLPQSVACFLRPPESASGNFP